MPFGSVSRRSQRVERTICGRASRRLRTCFGATTTFLDFAMGTPAADGGKIVIGEF